MAMYSMIAILAVTMLAACTAETALPLPAGCGAAVTAQSGDSCTSIAAYAGLAYSKFKSLNPSLPCNGAAPPVGSTVCTGGPLAFCTNPYAVGASDTCSTIANSEGSIIALSANTTCSTLTSSSTACVQPAANQCAVSSICGKTISTDMQQLLGTTPDYCTLVTSCSAGTLTSTTTAGVPSLTLTLSSITPSLSSVLNNPGHPELAAFASIRANATATLSVAFAPKAYDDGSSLVSFDGTVTTSRRSLRMSQGPRPPKGGTRAPGCWCCYCGK